VQDVAAAYDALAPCYDQQVQADAMVRRLLWKHYARLFSAGMRVLDVSCGTGIDAVFLARRGVQVVAIDISAGMVAELRRKVQAAGLAACVQPHVMDLAYVMDLAAIHCWPERSFDGMISAFAGLNTVADLAPFARDAARLLRPEGRLVIHLLNRCRSWDLLPLLARGRWRAARTMAQQRERTVVIGGRPVRHYLYTPEEAYRRFFARYFRLTRAYSLGALLPPATAHRVSPAMALLLGRIETRAGRLLLNWGRFYVLELAAR
jgi:ubiquinone/menaquinone biosynthesis C-methylase UbiE